ncbi:LuxR C-terminal-related transcriptional regulator [Pseudomonas alcaligenes]|jgi:LuxR family maltose regulon positive regulatory protein|uniref:LuxR C-terminal-related transcriptional regulator n=1 Tax=Aquipseudomonas alcaligenes TaxID=43263 RepID=UPI002E7B6E7E|nr:LuxR C-terminal-related transcriptional regulator [Pseudomonas alcaligenes]MEE1951554.1 LuxR C-terminal-related transcriptional regulator [Pseudomonas alcaligenes]
MDDRKPLLAPPGFAREELLELLRHCEQFPLTVLLAPAGSGKSTLLAHWQASRAPGSVVHYPLQARDNEPVRFFRHLAEAIRAQVEDFDVSWFNPFAAEMYQAPLVVGEYLADALNRIDTRLYVVLDDFQFINQPTILDVLLAMLERLEGPVRVILSGRNHPGFSLSRLKLENKLLYIDQHDLRLSPTQIQQLNAHLGGPELSTDYIDGLMAMTEGWMAGVKVALLAYARFGTVALERFNGSQPEIVDYFGHVVLKRLSPQMHDFLLSCALFERFDGELCDNVLERSGSALLLEDLAARELFMLPVAEQPGCYRYHALLHDFLAKRLSLHKPLEVPRLHGRAALVFRQRGELEPALLHAQRCDEPALFQALLEEACDLWVRTGHFAEVLKWLEPLSEVQLRERPRLLVPMILALTLSRRFHQARYCLDELATHSAGREGLEEPRRQVLALNLELFQHDLAFDPEGRWPGLLEAGVSSDTRALHLTILAYHHLMHGRLERSIGLALEAKALLAQTGQLFLESYADLIIALCHRNAGRPTCARKEVCQDYQRTQRSSPAWVNRATAMVVALYEQNQLAAAQQLCEDLMAMVTSSSATETIATVHITLSRLLYRRQSPGRAGRLLEQLSRILQLGNYARFASQVAQESMRQAFLDGRPAALDALAQRLGIEERLATGEWERVQPYDECWERYGLAAVYWLVARGAQPRACRILKVLAQSLHKSEMKARALVVEANLLVLEAPQLSEEQQVKALLQLVERFGIVNINRSVFDEAPGFAEAVFGLLRAGRLQVPEAYSEAYAEFLLAESRPQEAPLASLVSQLTEKEAEIFACLLRGLSNTEISASTGIALSTTKWHLKNIYSKLNLSGRTEAILAMQQRGS